MQGSLSIRDPGTTFRSLLRGARRAVSVGVATMGVTLAPAAMAASSDAELVSLNVYTGLAAGSISSCPDGLCSSEVIRPLLTSATTRKKRDSMTPLIRSTDG